MIKTIKFCCIFMVLLTAYHCGSKKNIQQLHAVEVQGHRGDRGNFPENTIQAFISAVKKGADVIELDVVISKDQKVVVSHENFMSSQYMLDLDGKPITKANEKGYNLYQMNYDSIRRFDSGSRGNLNFPTQDKSKAYKPLLSEVIDSIENYISKNNLRAVRYNIEIKSEKEDYGKRQPAPEVFSAMVMKVIADKGIEHKMNIQSFDPELLNVFHKKYPKVKIAFLVGNSALNKNLSKLDFKPEIYSPNYNLVNKAMLDSIRFMNMKIIPWTVNENKDIDRLLELKVDGIITDFPERVLEKH